MFKSPDPAQYALIRERQCTDVIREGVCACQENAGGKKPMISSKVTGRMFKSRVRLQRYPLGFLQLEESSHETQEGDWAEVTGNDTGSSVVRGDRLGGRAGG